MTNHDPFAGVRYTGSKPKVHLQITDEVLANLFNVSKRTIRQWRYEGKLDPTNLANIIECYEKEERKGNELVLKNTSQRA